MGINELKERLEKDVEFKEKLQHAKDATDLLNQIKEAGFDVDPNELVNTSSLSKKGELSDDDLEGVAGGGFWDDFWLGFKYGFTHPVEGIGVVIDELS